MTRSQLTAIAIDKLKPKAVRYEVADSQRGLKLVVFPSGEKSFICRYRFNGVMRKLTFGGIALVAARKAAADALFEVHQGRDPALAKQASKRKAAAVAAETVQAICERYLAAADGAARLRGLDHRKAIFARLIYPAIGSIPIDALRRGQVVELLGKSQKERGDRISDLTVAYLRCALNWYAKRADDFRTPLIAGMGRYNAVENARARVLTDPELRKIWIASEPTNGRFDPVH